MPIEFRCSSCGKLLRVGDDAAGRPVQCPECKHIGTAPAGAAGGDAGFVSALPDQGGVPPEQNPFQSTDQAFPPPDQNPFQSPTQAGGPPVDYQYGSQYAAGRVAGPAIGLIVAGSLSTGALLIFAVIFAFDFFVLPRGMVQPQPMGQPPIAAIMGGYFVLCLIGALLKSLVIIGAVKMKNLSSYGLATAAAIVAIIPCCVCWPVEAPFGIWALVVLNDPAVRAAFPR